MAGEGLSLNVHKAKLVLVDPVFMFYHSAKFGSVNSAFYWNKLEVTLDELTTLRRLLFVSMFQPMCSDIRRTHRSVASVSMAL